MKPIKKFLQEDILNSQFIQEEKLEFKYWDDPRYLKNPYDPLYHGSPNQQIKTMGPNKNLTKYYGEKVVFGSWFRPYAASFGLPYGMERPKWSQIDTYLYYKMIRGDINISPLLTDEQREEFLKDISQIKNAKIILTPPDNLNTFVTVLEEQDFSFIHRPCSLYQIKPRVGIWKATEFDNIYWNKQVPEAYTKSKCDVVSEIKYDTVLKCYKNNKLGLILVK